jgi:hypothetical protein
MTHPDPKAALEAGEYRKTATVKAVQAETGGVIPTLEGDHTYEAGDYICGPGAEGEYWPVKRTIFEATYELAALAPPDPRPDVTLDVEVLAEATAAIVGWHGPMDYHRDWAAKVAAEYTAILARHQDDRP